MKRYFPFLHLTQRGASNVSLCPLEHLWKRIILSRGLSLQQGADCGPRKTSSMGSWLGPQMLGLCQESWWVGATGRSSGPISP